VHRQVSAENLLSAAGSPVPSSQEQASLHTPSELLISSKSPFCNIKKAGIKRPACAKQHFFIIAEPSVAATRIAPNYTAQNEKMKKFLKKRGFDKRGL
jgi:hypothetical protein